MKTNVKTIYLAVVTLLVVTLTSCGGNDDSPTAERPTIVYDNPDIEATFNQAGSTTPTINWNNNTGTIELIESYTGGIPGLSISNASGKITWSKDLGEGMWIFDVEATNSAGTTIVEMSIDNTLQGTFTGTYDTTDFFQVVFAKDHTVIINADNALNPYTATGTWSINNDDIILVNYTYEGGGDYSLKGQLIRDGITPKYQGNWYFEYDAIETNLGGTIELDME